MDNLNEMTLKEFSEIFKYLLENNKNLQNEGKTPVAIGLEGAAGIGKTSIIQEVADELGMTLCKLNLAQLEEVGDLTGFPIKEVKVIGVNENGEEFQRWYPENLLATVPSNMTITSNIRMGYATPSWLPSEENPNGTILLLDDYTRASQLFMQATMELINEGKYISWSLPSNTTIVLTSNPDDGEFQVSSLDSAQKTRFINFNVKLCIDDWATWAEFAQIDGRCINFCLSYGHELFKKHNGIQTINPRAYTTFCKAISGVKDWQNEKSLGLILNISKGCFLNDKDNVVGTMFTTFVSQKLDKLISPKDMLLESWKTVEPKIRDCVFDGDKYRPEIASILATRLLNYIMYYFSQTGYKSSVVNDRLIELLEKGKGLLSKDLYFHVVKTVVSRYPKETGKLLLNAEIRKEIVS